MNELPALHGYWQRALGCNGASAGARDLDATLLSGLGLNVLETLRFLHGTHPSFEAFEAWVLEQNGGAIDTTRLERALAGEGVGAEVELDGVDGLTDAELAHWDEHGYVIVRNAAADAAGAADAIYAHLGVDPADPDTWYAAGATIWVPLLRHPAFRANRRFPRLVKAFAQLWGREDLWATIDQGGFNPPERPGWSFPGPHLHWDATLAPPHHFGVQGILYLTDTAADQGAFCCVPGFHHHVDAWLATLPDDVLPQDEARRTLAPTPIAANAGDLILWNNLLPHGASPNTSTRPRVVQYISMAPTRWAHHEVWR